jgi:hypothetical protein
MICGIIRKRRCPLMFFLKFLYIFIFLTDVQEAKWQEYGHLVDRVSGMRTQRVDSIMKEMTAETECPSVYWNLVYNKVREEYTKRWVK